MSRLSRLTPRELQTLSAYADGALTPAERRDIDARLAQDPALRQALQGIRATSALLRALPQVRPPRSFTLTPEMAGVRSGWLRYPMLQLATAMAALAFVITVGADVFGGVASNAVLRAAAPAQEIEAPAAVSPLPTQAGADAFGSSALPTATGTAMPEAAAMDAIAATPTAASEYASREAPSVGGAGDLPPATDVTGTAAPILEAAAASGPCEICGEVELPPPAPQEKLAADATPEGAMASPGPELQQLQPAPDATGLEERQPGGLPAVRWLEIGLAAIALTLAAFTLRAHRRVR
jgi:hypothetical protein